MSAIAEKAAQIEELTKLLEDCVSTNVNCIALIEELRAQISAREQERQFVSQRIAEGRQECIKNDLLMTRLHLLLCSTGLVSEDNGYLPFGESGLDGEVPAYLDKTERI